MSREILEGALYYLERGCDTEDEDTGKKFCENNSCIGGIPCAWILWRNNGLQIKIMCQH